MSGHMERPTQGRHLLTNDDDDGEDGLGDDLVCRGAADALPSIVVIICSSWDTAESEHDESSVGVSSAVSFMS